MSTPVTAFARAVSEATRARTSFSARQEIRAGELRVTARVRSLAPDRLIVEYEDYKSPLAELDDLLGGSAEFVGADLTGSTLFFDGKATTCLTSGGALALRTQGRSLYEPIPGLDMLGETRFLDDLARDYLLRDKGESTHGGRPSRVLGLKPKRAHASSVLRVVAFPFDRAEVTLDAETYFPLRVVFVPSPDLPIAPFLGTDPQVEIDYRDVREGPIEEAAFTPSLATGTRLIEENLVTPGELGQPLPFPLPLDVLRASGYELAGRRIQLALDASRERGFAVAPLLARGDEGQERRVVVLRVGNFVSRHMARRRSFAAERGEPVDVGGRPARYVDRRLALPDLPAAGAPALADLTWESEGVFWVLTADSVAKEDLIALATALTQSPTPKP